MLPLIELGHLDLLVCLLEGLLLTGLADFEELGLPLKFIDLFTLLMDNVLDLNDSLLKPNLHQNEPILWGISEE